MEETKERIFKRGTKLFAFFQGLYIKVFGFKFGVYLVDLKHTHIGKRVVISPFVQFYTQNHNIENPYKNVDAIEDIYIGDDYWLGANCIILPGVRLGDRTTVGAGSVVTKSFPDGWCVIAGNPAKKIKNIKKK